MVISLFIVVITPDDHFLTALDRGVLLDVVFRHTCHCVSAQKKICRTTTRKTIWKIALKNKNTEFFYKRQVDWLFEIFASD
jgi:hypothetical protein